ncbi:hypothetical protein I3760_09G216800 [Carya illinoinensis]|nr:hypothetical protein I3760_09G216800 [Carya illinoinensis]KAG2691009.1 hypothetical protein I3760_09G216800 [Carya illinoinensis]KAG2691010.1 hypothetical protein I3760_09G216800 [Carya illinoinensis]
MMFHHPMLCFVEPVLLNCRLAAGWLQAHRYGFTIFMEFKRRLGTDLSLPLKQESRGRTSSSLPSVMRTFPRTGLELL